MMNLSDLGKRRLSMIGIGVLIVGIVAVSAVSMGAFAQENPTQINESEPNDDRANATMLDPGTDVPSSLPPVRGTVDQNDSVDFFAFEVNAGQAINVYHGANLDNAEFALLNPDGEVIANQSDRQNVITLGDRADQSGTYYLRLTHSDVEDSEEYRFAIKLADEDSFEPNDNSSTATLLEPGSTINGTVVRDEADVFAVNASANDTITANISRREIFAGEPANVRLELLDANGELVGNESTSRSATRETYGNLYPDTRGRVRATVDDSGTYYLRVTLAGTTDQSLYGGHVGFADYSLEVDVHNDSATTPVTTTSAPPTTEEPTTTATTTEAETEAPSTTETNATPAIASIRIEANPSTVQLPSGDSGGSSNLNVTFRDSSGNYVEVIRNVTLTTERGVFLENGDRTITIPTFATFGGEEPPHGNVNLGSAEPGNVTVNAESDGITGSTTVTFVANDTEDGGDDGGKAKQPTDDDGTADGGNGKSKMGTDGDGDDAADGGNGKSKAN